MPVLPNATLPGASGANNNNLLQKMGSAAGSSVLGSVGLSPAATRQNVADMFRYSDKTAGPSPILIFPDASQDWRVRVSLAPNSRYFYNDPNNNLLSPLVGETGGGSSSGIGGAIGNIFGLSGAKRVGVVFPYTPQVQVQHSANYSAQKLTHNNYTQYFYDNSEVQAITVAGEFTVQNVTEGQYLLATVYFFRAVTKMFFGQDQNAGNPPPMVYLNGYGQYYFPNVPCVVTGFSHTMPADCDYMDIPEPGLAPYNPQMMHYRLNSTRLPTTSTISLTLQPVYSRLAQGQGFSLNDFAAGALVNPPGSGLPSSSFGSSQYSTNVNSWARSNGGFL
jgi:hypothetical protein